MTTLRISVFIRNLSFLKNSNEKKQGTNDGCPGSLGARQGGLMVSVDWGEMGREGLFGSFKVGSIKIYNNLIAIE